MLYWGICWLVPQSSLSTEIKFLIWLNKNPMVLFGVHSSAYSHSYFNFNKNCSTKITCVAIFSIPNKQSCVLYWRSKYLYFLASNTFLIWQGEKRTQGIMLNNTLLLFAPIILYIICLFLWQFLMSKKLWSQGFSLLHNWWIFYSLPHKRYT